MGDIGEGLEGGKVKGNSVIIIESQEIKEIIF